MMMIREGYKETEIGVIPEDWDVKELQKIADVKGGKRLPKGYTLEDRNTGFPYIRVADMYQGGVSISDIKYVPIEAEPLIKNYKISQEDIFISVAGTLGVIGTIPEELDNANLTENADKICNLKCDKNYLMYYLQSSYIQNIIDNERTVGAQPKLALGRIQKFLIGIPTQHEQKHIAEILSTTDAHIDKLDKIIEDYQLLKKGMMKKLLTEGIDHTEFKETEIGRIPKEWEVKSLSSIADKRKKHSFVDGDWIEREHLVEDGIRLIQTGNIGVGSFIEKDDKKYINEKSFSDLKCKEVYLDDILICRMAEPTGRSCIMPKLGVRMITSVDCVILRIDKSLYDNRFIDYCINSEDSLQFSFFNQQGTTRRRITRKKLGELPLPIPSLTEQRLISAILSEIDNCIILRNIQRQEFSSLKKSLMEKLLTGKVRVV